MVYEGQSQALNTASAVSAAHLAAADIVLTTYDVLRRDLHHEPGDAAFQRTLRVGKKYEVSTPYHKYQLQVHRLMCDEQLILWHDILLAS